MNTSPTNDNAESLFAVMHVWLRSRILITYWSMKFVQSMHRYWKKSRNGYRRGSRSGILALVCDTINTDLIGSLSQGPYEWVNLVSTKK